MPEQTSVSRPLNLWLAYHPGVLIACACLYLFSAAGYSEPLDDPKAIDRLINEAPFAKFGAVSRLRKLGPKAVDVLVEVLLDKASQASRATAAQKLGLIGDPRAAEPLIQVLNDADDDPTVRDCAADALGRLNTPAAVDAMLTALTDKEALVQWGAARGLGRTGNPKVLGPLAEQFGSEHFYVRSTAASSIKWIVGAARRDKLEIQGSLGPIALRLIPLLKDEDAQVREAAAETLGTLGDRRAYEPVKSLLQDKVPSVRAAAVEALKDLPGPQTGEGLVERLGDESSKVREAAASALGGVANAEAVEALIATLSNTAEEWAIRQQAAWSLGESGDSRAMDALLVALRDRNENIRSAAALALGELGDPGALNGLIETLNDSTREVRLEAVSALGVLGDSRAVPPLIALLTDQDMFMRYAVVRSLGDLRDARALASLATSLVDQEPLVAGGAAWALGELGEPKAVEPLLRLLQTRATHVAFDAEHHTGRLRNARSGGVFVGVVMRGETIYPRAMAAASLGKLGNLQAVEALIAALSDPNAYVRYQAAWALSRFKDNRAEKALIERLQGRDLLVVAASHEFFISSISADSTELLMEARSRYGDEETLNALRIKINNTPAQTAAEPKVEATPLSADFTPDFPQADELAALLEGVYERDKETTYYDSTMEKWLPLVTTDNLTIVSKPDNTLYIDLNLVFGRMHTCFLQGYAVYHRDDFIYRDDQSGSATPTNECLLKIRRQDTGVHLAGNKECDAYCGAHGSLKQVEFPFSVRVSGEAKNYDEGAVATLLEAGEFGPAGSVLHFLKLKRPTIGDAGNPAGGKRLTAAVRKGLKKVHAEAMETAKNGNYELAHRRLGAAVSYLEENSPNLIDDYPWLLNDYGYFLEQDGHLNGAETVLRGVVKRFPGRAVARLNLADVLWAGGKIDDAANYYQGYAKSVKPSKWPKRLTERCSKCVDVN